MLARLRGLRDGLALAAFGVPVVEGADEQPAEHTQGGHHLVAPGALGFACTTATGRRPSRRHRGWGWPAAMQVPRAAIPCGAGPASAPGAFLAGAGRRTTLPATIPSTIHGRLAAVGWLRAGRRAVREPLVASRAAAPAPGPMRHSVIRSAPARRAIAPSAARNSASRVRAGCPRQRNRELEEQALERLLRVDAVLGVLARQRAAEGLGEQAHARHQFVRPRALLAHGAERQDRHQLARDHDRDADIRAAAPMLAADATSIAASGGMSASREYTTGWPARNRAMAQGSRATTGWSGAGRNPGCAHEWVAWNRPLAGSTSSRVLRSMPRVVTMRRKACSMTSSMRRLGRSIRLDETSDSRRSKRSSSPGDAPVSSAATLVPDSVKVAGWQDVAWRGLRRRGPVRRHSSQDRRGAGRRAGAAIGTCPDGQNYP